MFKPKWARSPTSEEERRVTQPRSGAGGGLIVLATLRHDHRLAGMAGGNSVSASTIDRWTWEVIGLLAARAPRLDRALAAITRQGGRSCCWTAP